MEGQLEVDQGQLEVTGYQLNMRSAKTPGLSPATDHLKARKSSGFSQVNGNKRGMKDFGVYARGDYNLDHDIQTG